MKSTSPNHKRTRREIAHALKSAILALLHWSELDYANMQYESGLLYLETYLPGDQYAIDILSRSRIFWNWYKNHWTNRDESFLSLFNSVHIKSVTERRQLYNEYNLGSNLTKDIRPNRTVLKESYDRVIKVKVLKVQNV